MEPTEHNRRAWDEIHRQRSAELGAIVTGVESSGTALELARERWPSILWVQADPQALPGELRRGRFDLVYAGPGSLTAVHDLDSWLRGVAATLRSGGDLLLFEEHPVALCVDGLMHWRESYFDEGSRRLGQVVTATARAGLTPRALE